MIRSRFGDKIIAWVLKSNKDGWVLTQRGNKYTLEQLSDDPESEELKIEHNDSEEIIEDRLGKMHNFKGVPLGLRNDKHRPVVDVETAEVAVESDKKVTDGGEIKADDEMSLTEIQNHLLIGSMNTASGNQIRYVNPFLEPDEDIVDLRDTMQLFRHASSPTTPIKAAKNAVEAERAVSSFDLGQVGQLAGMLGAFLLGAIVTEFIAGSSGSGGGGGGGVDIGLQIVSTLMMSMPL